MTGRRRIGLDGPIQGTRGRDFVRSASVTRQPAQKPPATVRMADVTRVQTPAVSPNHATVESTQKSRAHHAGAASNPALPRQTRSMVLARQMVRKTPKKRVPHVTHKSRMSALLVVMALAIFMGGTIVSYLGWKANSAEENSHSADVLAKNTEISETMTAHATPSEEEVTPDVIAGYEVAPDLPRLIRIPRLQVEARIKRMVTNTNNELGAPSNIADAGWYDGSVRPGSSGGGGATLLTGYASGPTKPGVFQRVGSLREGDVIEVEQGDGKVISYKVAAVELVDYDKVDMDKALAPIVPEKGGLSLVTMSERYDIRTNKYEQKYVVYAVQQ